MRNDVPPCTVKIVSASTFLTLAGVDPSSDQCFNCFHFRRGSCELGLPLAMNRDSDVCGWWSTW